MIAPGSHPRPTANSTVKDRSRATLSRLRRVTCRELSETRARGIMGAGRGARGPQVTATFIPAGFQAFSAVFMAAATGAADWRGFGFFEAGFVMVRSFGP